MRYFYKKYLIFFAFPNQFLCYTFFRCDILQYQVTVLCVPNRTGNISTQTMGTCPSPQQVSNSPDKSQVVVAKTRPHTCEECGKTFLMKHHLSTHLRIHSGERPHICPECGKSFALKHCLSTHLLLHTADRPYKCLECNKSFTLKHHLVCWHFLLFKIRLWYSRLTAIQAN